MTDPQGSRDREHHLQKPTAELRREARLRRHRRYVRLLVIATILIVAMVVYSAVFDLDSWLAWIGFGVICAAAVGTMFAVLSRS